MLKYSYCKMHDTYPQDDEPCWGCIRRFTNETLNPSDSIVVENQENTKPCRVDGKTPCVQYSEEDECSCDPCEICEVSLTYTKRLQQIIKRMLAVKKASDSGQALISCQGQAMDSYSELANYRSILEEFGNEN